VIACNNNSGVPQGIIAANVQGATMGANSGMPCAADGEFIYVPQSPANPPGPDTSNNMLVTETGTGDLTITCSVIPNSDGSSYSVSAQAVISGGTAPGTLTISAMSLTPRSRMGDGGPPNMDQVAIQNITMDYLDPTKHLRQTNCTAQYVLANDGQPGLSLPDQADTFADSNGGRFWLSVFCEDPQSLEEAMKPGFSGCAMSATVRFENCSSHM
jgi:hypothetical protein